MIINDYNITVVTYTGHYLVISHRCRVTGSSPSGIYYFCHGGWIRRIQVALDGVVAHPSSDLGSVDRIQRLDLPTDAVGKQLAATRWTRRLFRGFRRTLHFAVDLPNWPDQRTTNCAWFDRDCRQPVDLWGVAVPLDASLTIPPSPQKHQTISLRPWRLCEKCTSDHRASYISVMRV